MKKVAMLCFGDVRQPKNGYALRCLMLARKLSAGGNKVTIFQFTADDGHTSQGGIEIFSLSVRHEQPSRSRLSKLLSLDPLRELRFPFEGYRKLAQKRELLQTFDVFYVEGCLLINAFVFAKRLKKPLVLDTHCINKDVALKLRQKSKLSGSIRVWVWHTIERVLTRRADLVIAISDQDRTFIAEHYGLEREGIDIIPHEVAAADAETHKAEAAALRTKLGKGFQKIACFLGDLGAIQNQDSERYIREELAPSTPSVHYVLVGNNPQNLPNQSNITYTGFVDAFDPYILAADFCIAPVAIGSGVKTKVLDYMKYDKPVVATPVAAEGIGAYAHMRVHDLPDFRSGVKQLAEAGI